MKIHLGTYFDIPLFPHWTWFLFLPIILMLNGVIGLAIMFVAFVFVTLHEYGHCLMAKFLSLKVKDVTLYPIGGLARLQIPFNSPGKEFLVAIAGPAVNFVFASIFITVLILMPQPQGHDLAEVWQNHPIYLSVACCFWINVIMLLFNMLPVFPMDGGRVFRATAVALTGDFLGATTFTVRFAQVICLALIALAFWLGSIWIAVIFLLLFVASQNELVAARHYTSIHNIRRKVSFALDRPELATAPLTQVIAALEDVEDEELRENLKLEELIPLLKDVEAAGQDDLQPENLGYNGSSPACRPPPKP